MVPNYSFYGWGKFSASVRAARIVLLRGDYGTGKTLFAVALGYHMLRHRWVESTAYNFPVRGVIAGKPIMRRCLAVIDEGGRVFDAREAYRDKFLNSLSGDLAFGLRKRGSYVVMPSYLDVDKRFRNGLRIHRHFPAGDRKYPNWFEKNFWIYYWERGEEDTELQQEGINYWRGTLIFRGATSFYNAYDTYFQPPKKLILDFIHNVARASSNA